MGHWDRTRRPVEMRPKTERLNRLDYELMVSREKAFDYVYAVGQGMRVRCCIMRDQDNKVWATATVGGKALKCGGGYSPSGAFLLLTVAIKTTFAQLPEAGKAEARLQNPINCEVTV